MYHTTEPHVPAVRMSVLRWHHKLFLRVWSRTDPYLVPISP